MMRALMVYWLPNSPMYHAVIGAFCSWLWFTFPYISVEWVPRNRTAISLFIKSHSSQSDCTNLHPQNSHESSNCPTSSLTFQPCSEYVGTIHCAYCGFLAWEVEHISICLLTIWVTFYDKFMLESFADLYISCVGKLLSMPTASLFDRLWRQCSHWFLTLHPFSLPQSQQPEGLQGQSICNCMSWGVAVPGFSQNSSTSLHSHQKCIWDPLDAYPFWPLVWTDF